MTYRLLLKTVLLFLITTQAIAESNIEITSPWVRSAPPTVAVMAGYLQLSNHGHETVTLDAVSSPQFHSVELHRTKMHDDGMMHMEKIKALKLESRQKISFEPGGYHLMLMDPHQPLARGKEVELIMEFSNGEKIKAIAKVQDMAPGATEMDHSEGHQHH